MPETALVWMRSLSLMSYQAMWASPDGETARATRPCVVGHGPLLVVGEGPCPGRVGEVADALVVGGQVMGPRLVDLVLEVAV